MNFNQEQIENMHLYSYKKETDCWTDIGLLAQSELGKIILPDGEEDCDGLVTYDEWEKKKLQFYFFDELTHDQEKKLKEIVKEYMYDYGCPGCGKVMQASATVDGYPCSCGGIFGRL
jgi:hypothetical protein